MTIETRKLVLEHTIVACDTGTEFIIRVYDHYPDLHEEVIAPDRFE